MLDIFFLFLAFCCGAIYDFLFLSIFILMWMKLIFNSYKTNNIVVFVDRSVQTCIIGGTVFIVVQITNYIFPAQSFSSVYANEINDLFPYLNQFKDLHVYDAFPSDHAALASCLLLIVSPLLSKKMGFLCFVFCIPALFARLFFGFHSIWDMLGSVFVTYVIVFIFRFSKFAKYLNQLSKYISKLCF